LVGQGPANNMGTLAAHTAFPPTHRLACMLGLQPPTSNLQHLVWPVTLAHAARPLTPSLCAWWARVNLQHPCGTALAACGAGVNDGQTSPTALVGPHRLIVAIANLNDSCCAQHPLLRLDKLGCSAKTGSADAAGLFCVCMNHTTIPVASAQHTQLRGTAKGEARSQVRCGWVLFSQQKLLG
jgi:hypothetical protein